MDSIVNLYAGASGLWKKVAALLPLLLGAATLLSGLAGLLNEFGHAANAAALLALFQGLQKDPNLGLVVAGLAALGIHTNHQVVTAQVAAATGLPLPNAPAAPPPAAPPPAAKP